MIDFDYQAPAQLDEALALLQQHGDDARVIAGGTALVILMKQRLVQPELLVSLRRIPELDAIRADNGTLHLGATATHRAVETHPVVRERWPLLAETFRHVATVRIRNMATVGGSLAHGDPNQDPPPALIAVACLLTLEPGTTRCRDVRLALGSAGTTPIRAEAAEAALRGEDLTPARL